MSIELYPKRAFTFVELDSNEDVYEVRIKIKDIPGAIVKVASIIAEAQVNIKMSTFFNSPVNKKEGFWTAFIDISKSKTEIEELVKRLRKLDVVLDVSVEKPEPALYDVMHFPMLHGDQRAILFPLSFLRNLFDEIEKILTPSGSAAVFYNAGKRSGENYVKYYKEKFGLKSREELIKTLIMGTSAVGWGKIETYALDLSIPAGSIRVKKNIEAIMHGKKATQPICHWTRGFMAGYLTALTGVDVEIVETKCLGKGDEYCEFEVKAKLPGEVDVKTSVSKE